MLLGADLVSVKGEARGVKHQPGRGGLGLGLVVPRGSAGMTRD